MNDLIAAFAKFLTTPKVELQERLRTEFEEAIARTNLSDLTRAIDSGEWQLSLLMGIAEQSLNKRGLSKQRAKEIKETSNRLRAIHGRLIAAKLTHQHIAIITELVDQAFFLGAACSEDIADGALFRMHEAQTLMMRRGKEQLAIPRHDAIDRAILAASGKAPLEDSYKFAEGISGAVQKALPRIRGTSVKALRRRIRVILEERRNK